MQLKTRSSLALGLAVGVALTAAAAMLMGQSPSQPVRSETQYFVTGEGDHAHLWVREGTNLRVVGHGECKAGCPWDKDAHDHKPGDGHDHDTPAPKK